MDKIERLSKELEKEIPNLRKKVVYNIEYLYSNNETLEDGACFLESNLEQLYDDLEEADCEDDCELIEESINDNIYESSILNSEIDENDKIIKICETMAKGIENLTKFFEAYEDYSEII